MSVAEEIRDNFSKMFPSESFQVIQASNYCVSSFNGELLLKVKLEDGNYLLVLKMRVSDGPKISNDEVFQKAFPWVYESKKTPDVDRRRDFLKENISNLFPQYHVLVLMFKAGQSWAAPYAKAKANAVFAKDYGDHDIIIILY